MSSKIRPQYIVFQRRFVHINIQDFLRVHQLCGIINKIDGLVKSLFYFFRIYFCFLSDARNMQNFWLNCFF